MSGRLIPDSDHVSRYCKPSVVQNGLPIVAAFLARPNEEYVSVNWVEYLDARDLPVAIGKVRAGFQRRGYSLRPNGRFVVLNVGSCKESATRVNQQVRFEHLPRDDDRSHAGIVGIGEDDFAVAAEITRLVAPKDVHPAIA